tara:strand:- start:2773 stop:3009 length:237 start_codon:yes stop_codon:yes gene_type:complete
MPKKKKINIVVTEKHHKALQWCLQNDIKVGVLPTKKGLKVEIDERGKKIISPETYSQEDAQKKCWQLYLYLYNKYWKL